MHIQIVNFHLKGLSEDAYRKACDELAPSYLDVPGLISKVWLVDAASSTYGGVITWESREAMEAFAKTELARGVYSGERYKNALRLALVSRNQSIPRPAGRRAETTNLPLMRRLAVLAAGAMLVAGSPTRADLLTPGTTHLISFGETHAASYGVVSGDGTVVAFDSLVDAPALGDANGDSDVYVRDLRTGRVELISAGTDGASRDGDSSLPSVSRDGRYVAFTSRARLVAEDVDGRNDAYVRDRQTGAVTLASPGDPARIYASRPVVSDDGGTVAFQDEGISVWHRTTGTVRHLADHAQHPSITGDGERVAFFALEDLVPEDTDGAWDIYIAEVATGALTLVTGDIDVATFTPDLSADSRRIAFMAMPLHQLHPVELHVRDLATAETRIVTSQAEPYDAPAISGDGEHVVFSHAGIVSISTTLPLPRRPGVYVWAWSTGTADIASTSSMGTNEPIRRDGDPDIGCLPVEETCLPFPMLGVSLVWGASNPTVSDDGRFVAFDGPERLSPEDTDSHGDVFIRDRSGPCSITCVEA